MQLASFGREVKFVDLQQIEYANARPRMWKANAAAPNVRHKAHSRSKLSVSWIGLFCFYRAKGRDHRSDDGDKTILQLFSIKVSTVLRR
jgi:hypothetical protein